MYNVSHYLVMKEILTFLTLNTGKFNPLLADIDNQDQTAEDVLSDLGFTLSARYFSKWICNEGTE